MNEPLQTLNEYPLLLNLLLANKLIEKAGIEAALREQSKRNCSLEEALLFAQVVPELAIAKTYAEHLHVPLVSSPDPIDAFDETLKTLLPEAFVRESRIAPLYKQHGVLHVAALDPTDLGRQQELQLYTGLRVSFQAATLSAIEQCLDSLYGAEESTKETLEQAAPEAQADIAKETEEDVLDLDRVLAETRETKIVRMLNKILTQALQDRCSDIHMEPFPNECKIRFRIDGVLHEIPPPPLNLFIPLVSRIKIVSKLDIAEKRVPQDGAFSMKVGENKVDVRVSTVPTVYGEKVVMRLLNKDAVPLDLAKLGFTQRQQEDFMKAASSPHGLLFVTGPTGSGKSTTLYATLKLLTSPRKNILTVEDPVEYKFVGINQVQVKPQVELTFARALRAFLRQDPDVIMVGEVRDNETAQICLRAALTGHFVLSTLHTNSALAAVSRLADMGVEPFLLAATLRLVEAQRLVRRLCQHCKEPFKPPQELVDKFHLPPDKEIFRPKACKECREAGYRGRVGVFEAIRITPALRKLIEERAPLAALEEAARKDGMQTLFDNGLVKVQEGLTSIEEITELVAGGE